MNTNSCGTYTRVPAVSLFKPILLVANNYVSSSAKVECGDVMARGKTTEKKCFFLVVDHWKALVDLNAFSSQFYGFFLRGLEQGIYILR